VYRDGIHRIVRSCFGDLAFTPNDAGANAEESVQFAESVLVSCVFGPCALSFGALGIISCTVKFFVILAAGAAALSLMYFGALFVAHRFNRDFLAIDSCLDSGGRWNYTTRCCEH
jgi:hypothetical protein